MNKLPKPQISIVTSYALLQYRQKDDWKNTAGGTMSFEYIVGWCPTCESINLTIPMHPSPLIGLTAGAGLGVGHIMFPRSTLCKHSRPVFLLP